MSKQVGGAHYQMAIEPIEFIVKNDIEYRAANVIKYVVRHKKKNGLEDLKKAIHYIEMLMEDYDEGDEQLEAEENAPSTQERYHQQYRPERGALHHGSADLFPVYYHGTSCEAVGKILDI